MDVATVLERVLDEPRVTEVRAILDTYGRAPGTLLANGLAFATLFTTVPVTLISLGLAGAIAKDPVVSTVAGATLARLFPPLRDVIDGAMSSLINGAGITSVIGLVGTVWTVSQLYVALDLAFSRIFGDEPSRSAIRRTARGLLWVVALLGLIVGLIVLGTLASALQAVAPGATPGAEVIGDILASPVVIVGLAIGVVALAFRFLPPRAPDWRTVGAPALVAGVAIAVLSQVFLFIAPRVVGSIAFVGSLATVFIALAWLSLTFQALLYGAAWVSVRDERVRLAGSGALGSDAPGALGSDAPASDALLVPAASTEAGVRRE